MSAVNATAQDDELDKRLFFGVNVGVKFANKNYANRYGGWYQNQLDNALMNLNNYNTIFEMLGQNHFDLDESGFPIVVRYRPGIVTGVTAGYKLSPNLQMNIDANFSKLKVITGYTIIVIDPSITVSQEQYRTGEILGEESRFNGRFNLDYIIEGDPVNFIVGANGLFSGWRIDNHTAYFQTFQMPLFSVHNQANNFTAKTGGIGWGMGLNLGAEYRFTESIVAQLMYQPYFQRMEYWSTKNDIANLGDSYIKPPFRLEHDLTVRILWK